MNGRVEIENKIQKKIEEKIKNLPQIFDDFYNYLESYRDQDRSVVPREPAAGVSR